MNRDEAKRLVLARRATFLAAAVATSGLACPSPCLKVAPADAGAGGTDASPPPGEDADTPTPTADAEPPKDVDASIPVPCLKIAPTGSQPITPQPCLSVAPPRVCLKPPAPRDRGCDPPYTVGPDGKKRYKPECL